MGAVRAVCAPCERDVPPVSGRIALCICGKSGEKTRFAGWCCTLAPGIRNFNEVGCAWACCTGSPADLGGVGSRKINTEVGQLQNCSASVWCAKKLGDNCIVGAFFGKEKETPLALVLLYITYSWVLLKIEPRCSYQPTVGLRPAATPGIPCGLQIVDDSSPFRFWLGVQSPRTAY